MLLIACPFCGPRDELEFRCGGEAHLVRPDPGASEEIWARYLFYRSNPRGVARERWVHSRGCRQWFNAVRDTVTHEILAVYAMDVSPPEAFS